MSTMSEPTGRELRVRYAAGLRRAQRQPSIRAGLLFAAALLSPLVLPALADGAPAYRLQGTSIATEFVNQPYAMAAGTLDGRHVNLQSGLLGFTDGQGVTGTGYCIDARTHRRHDAAYTEGAAITGASVANAGAVLWLLRHAYPNGPALLGGGTAGLARSSSVVQAAIWHFSDGFQLDDAGRPFVDPAYRAAYDGLLTRAAGAAPRGHALLTIQGPAEGTVRADQAFSVVVHVSTDDGVAAPDGTIVLVSSNAATMAAEKGAPAPHGPGNPLQVRTSDGRGVVIVGAGPSPGSEISIAARAQLPTPPGRLLVSSVPNQRLVETSWGHEQVQAGIHLAVIARPSPVPTVAPRPTVSPTPVTLPRTPSPPASPPSVTATPGGIPPPTPIVPTTPGQPMTGHDVRPSLVISVLCTLAGLVILRRSRRAAGL